MAGWACTVLALMIGSMSRNCVSERARDYKAAVVQELGGDARVMAVQYDDTGARHRPWRDSVVKIGQVEFVDGPMLGPRTVLWCCQFVDRRGGGPLEHRRWWVSNNRLQATDFGVQEHGHGMRAFQYFGECDQLGMFNVCGIQVLSRCELIEYHREKKSKSQAIKEQTAGIAR